MAIGGSASAAAPALMNYQGRLTDLSGAPMDTTVSITFAVYNDSVTATPRWSETHDSVAVHDGLFHVLLGSVQMLDYSLFDSLTLWLGVKVGGDTEISPRTRIVSVAFAQRVSTIDNTSGGTVYGSVSITSDLDVGGRGTFGGGHTNTGSYGFVAGFENSLTGDRATIGGGGFNVADGEYGTVAGGVQNEATTRWATVGGGNINRAWDTAATVAGGNGNRAEGPSSTIGGGTGNFVTGTGATVSGGTVNSASGYGASVGGGIENIADGTGATVGGGAAAYAQADYATACGGFGVVATPRPAVASA